MIRSAGFNLAPTILTVAVAVAGTPTALAAGKGDSAPTLRSLEKQHIKIDQSKAGPVDPQEILDNYRDLLKLTRVPVRRVRIKRRLADAELAVAQDAADPQPGARRAIELYQQLLKQGAIKVQRAQLRYSIARAADLAGDTATAVTALSRLITNHPDSPLVPEAHFRRAQMHFVGHQYTDAADDYAWLVARGDQTPFLLQARYKLGWSRYKLGDYRDSLEQFSNVLRSQAPPGDIGTDGKLQLDTLPGAVQEMVNDSLRGIVLDFAKLGKTLTPHAYATANGLGAYEYAFYNRLVAFYLKQERYTDAANAALAFAQANPEHPQAQAFELRAISALEDGGFPSQARKRKQDLVMRYGVQGKPWNGKPPLQVPAVKKRLRSYLDEITRYHHAQAQDSDKPKDYLQAAHWYAIYLKVFPDSPRAGQLAYRRADMLYAARHYAEAAKAYSGVAYGQAQFDKAADAGYAAVLARRKAAGDNTGNDPQVRKASLRYASQYPEQPQASAVLSRLAEDEYAAGAHTQAAATAALVIAHQPAAPSDELVRAWRIRAAVAEDNKQYADAEKALRWLLANAPGDKPGALRERLAAAIYKQGEQALAQGDDKAARKQFLRIQDAVPTHGGAASTIRATALFDAAAASVNAGDKPQAIDLLERFVQTYPRNKRAPEARRKLAALYLDTGDKAAAARAFASIRQQAGASADTRREAALQTAQLRAETGDAPGAIDAYKSYLRKHHPAFGEAMEARAQLVKLYTQRGATGKANYWRRHIITADAAAGAQRNERSRTLAANAAVNLADQARRHYALARLTPPLKRSLPRKKNSLQKALDAYGKAVDYDIADVTTEATYRIGQLYYDFSQTLLHAPQPSGLSDQELAQYKIQLEDLALPFEQKAINIQQANVQRIAEGTYDQWIKKSLAQLAQLVPARYAKQERLSHELANP